MFTASFPSPRCVPALLLYDHLRNTLSTKRLTALELLTLEPSERIEDGRDHQKDGRDNQARSHGPDADPLYDAHHGVDGGAHVVGAEFTDEGVELRGGRADAEEQRDLNEYDEKGVDSMIPVRRRSLR
jgi:hypothetical protein